VTGGKPNLDDRAGNSRKVLSQWYQGAQLCIIQMVVLLCLKGSRGQWDIEVLDRGSQH